MQPPLRHGRGWPAGRAYVQPDVACSELTRCRAHSLHRIGCVCWQFGRVVLCVCAASRVWVGRDETTCEAAHHHEGGEVRQSRAGRQAAGKRGHT